MAIWLGTTYFDNYANYELSYDLLSQSTQGNYSVVRLYGTLHVTGYSIGWSWGTASVYTESAGIGTYYSRGDYVVIQRDFTFYHDNNGNFSSWIGGGISTSYHSGDTGGTMTLPKINRQANVTGATDFTDESNPTITFSNPAGFRINARLEFSGDSIQRNNIPNTGSYTFDLTNEERELLRSKIPTSNSLTIREVIATCYSGTTESAWSYQDKKMTLVNANPIFSNYTFEDINPITLALTGDSSINVNGYSNTKVTISTLNKAEAQKYATMSKYRYTNSIDSIDIAYSNDSVVYGVINGTKSGTHNVYAIDSRNNTPPAVVKFSTTELNYEPIYINKQNSKIERDDNRVGDNAVLTLNGTLWNENFGDVVNSITSVTYRLKKTDSSIWIDGTTTITPTITDNSFTFTGMIASDNQDTSWDLDSSYNVEVTIEDELSISTVSFVLNSAIPTMSLDKDGVGIMCAYDSSEGGSLQVDGKDILNIIKEKTEGVELYSTTSTSATSSQIPLNDDASNYYCIEVFYGYGMGTNYESITSSRIYSPNGKTINLSLFLEGSGGTNIQLYTGIFSISSNKITPLNWYGGGQVNNNGATSVGKNYTITIIKVIGYK